MSRMVIIMNILWMGFAVIRIVENGFPDQGTALENLFIWCAFLTPIPTLWVLIWDNEKRVAPALIQWVSAWVQRKTMEEKLKLKDIQSKQKDSSK